ncbi:MAG: SCO family protein [Rhodospirillaceae bacterium]
MKKLALIVASVAAFVVVAAVGLMVLYGGGSGSTGIAKIGGPFALTDQDGRTRTDADFRGSLMMVYFGYTYCPDACPTALLSMTQALDMLGPDAEKVVPVFITIDPARDTADQLKLYAQNFHPRTVMLTGTPEQVAAAAKAYRVYYAKAKGSEDEKPDQYLMDHTSIIYLMGRDGRYITHFTHATQADKIAETLRKHL